MEWPAEREAKEEWMIAILILSPCSTVTRRGLDIPKYKVYSVCIWVRSRLLKDLLDAMRLQDIGPHMLHIQSTYHRQRRKYDLDPLAWCREGTPNLKFTPTPLLLVEKYYKSEKISERSLFFNNVSNH